MLKWLVTKPELLKELSKDRFEMNFSTFKHPAMIKKISLLLLVFVMACGNKNLPGTKDQQQAYKNIAAEKLGSDVEFIPNELKNFLLCLHDEKSSAENPENNLRLLVYDLTTDKVSLELNVGSGTAKWISTYELEVFYKPKVIQRGETRDDYVTIYNLTTGEKRNKK